MSPAPAPLYSRLLGDRGVLHAFVPPGAPLALAPGAGPVGAEAVVLPRQVHGTRVARPGELGDEPADGLWATGGAPLGIRTADCIPVLMACDDGAVAAIHAGWRGVAGGIVEGFLAAQAAADRPARRWVAAMGPAAGWAYEVGPEVAAELGLPAERMCIDLRGLLAARLEALGVAAVERVGPCTMQAGPPWASYRREGKAAGRNLAVIAP